VNGSGANAINARGWIAGFSQTGELDPVTGFPAGHAVLWKDDQIMDLGTLSTGIQSSGNWPLFVASRNCPYFERPAKSFCKT